MSTGEKEIVDRFIAGMQGIMLGMQKVDNSCMEAFGAISKRDFTLCVMLGQEESMIMREVSEFLGVPMSTATGIVDKLIERGLLVRHYSPEDRRIVMVALSEEGKSIYKMLQESMFRFGCTCLNAFDDQEKETLVSLMEKAAAFTPEMVEAKEV